MADIGDETEEWQRARLGKATASRIYHVIGQRKDGGWYAARKHYFVELIAERLTGMAADPYLSSDMLWGIETEPLARAAYEARTGNKVEKAGFVDHPFIPMSGASPDGYVGSDGLVEIKCPKTLTHVETLIEKPVDEEYAAQCQWQLACTGRKWVDFCSFDPRVPDKLRLKVIRLRAVPAIIAGMEKMVAAFLKELDETIHRLTEGAHVESSDIAADLPVTNLFQKRGPL